MLEHLDGLSKPIAWDEDVRAKLRARLSEWHGFLSREPVVARQIFRKLIDGQLKMTPRITPEGRFYDVQGRATYGRLLEGVISVVGLVPPG